jgi:hypothetical protein
MMAPMTYFHNGGFIVDPNVPYANTAHMPAMTAGSPYRNNGNGHYNNNNRKHNKNKYNTNNNYNNNGGMPPNGINSADYPPLHVATGGIDNENNGSSSMNSGSQNAHFIPDQFPPLTAQSAHNNDHNRSSSHRYQSTNTASNFIPPKSVAETADMNIEIDFLGCGDTSEEPSYQENYTLENDRDKGEIHAYL